MRYVNDDREADSSATLRNDKGEVERRERLRRLESRFRNDNRYLFVGNALLAEAAR